MANITYILFLTCQLFLSPGDINILFRLNKTGIFQDFPLWPHDSIHYKGQQICAIYGNDELGSAMCIIFRYNLNWVEYI